MPQQPRYVELPNGSYLEWPEGVTADQFKAKALTVMGQKPTGTPVRPDNAMDELFQGATSISAPHRAPGLQGIENDLNTLRMRFEEFGDRGFAQGATANNPLTSIPEGLMKLLKGVVEVPQGKLWQGTKDIVGGGLKTSELPAAFMAPEVKAVASSLIPSTERAGKIFSELEAVAGKIPVDVNAPGKVATKIWDLAEAGGTLPKVINKFLRRVTNPSGQPMTYSEMRQFYQNATRLSADEMNRLTPAVKRLVGQFTHSMGDSLWSAAESVGQGGKYNKAMKMYRTASKVKEFTGEKLPKIAKAAALGAAGTAGAGAAYKLYEAFK